MQLNMDKFRCRAPRDSSHSRLALTDSHPYNRSRDHPLLFTKKASLQRDGDKENSRPHLLNSPDCLVQHFLSEKPSKQTLDKLKADLGRSKAATVTLTKDSLLHLLEKLTLKKDPADEVLAPKKSLASAEKRPQMSMAFLEDMRSKALKNLVNEKFDEVLAPDTRPATRTKSEAVSETVQRLFQKELLFEQALNLLTEDEVDINQLLFCAFERIQSENYCPPTGESVLLDGPFEFGDQLRMPTSRWRKDKRAAREFRLNIEGIQELEDG